MKTQQKSGSLAKASRTNRTKLIAVWHVEYVHKTYREPGVMLCDSYEDAVEAVNSPQAQWYRCITITGPHQHRIPA